MFPFIPSVTTNIIALVKDLGADGLVGLLALGFIALAVFAIARWLRQLTAFD